MVPCGQKGRTCCTPFVQAVGHAMCVHLKVLYISIFMKGDRMKMQVNIEGFWAELLSC